MERITTIELFKLVEKHKMQGVTYESILFAVTGFRRTVENYGKLKRVPYRDKKGVIMTCYDLTLPQAMMVVTQYSDKSIVYLVRELLFQEEDHGVPHLERDSDELYMERSNESVIQEYNELTRCLSLISTPLALVNSVILHLRSFIQPELGRGSISLVDFMDMCSEATGVEVDEDMITRAWTSVGIYTPTGKLSKKAQGHILHTPNGTDIDLVWIANYLDDILPLLYKGI